MSNITNFFGSSNGSLGPCNIYVDPVVETGDTGDNVFLSGTQGLTLAYTITKGPLTADQEGTESFNEVITGERCEISGALVQTTLESIEAVLQGFISYSSGADGAAQATALGEDDLSIATPIELIRITDGAESSEEDDRLIVPVCAPIIEASWAYNASDQRTMPIRFRCYKSAKYTDNSTGKGLYFFLRSALTAGEVAVGSADLL
jgi:hypothetical protein